MCRIPVCRSRWLATFAVVVIGGTAASVRSETFPYEARIVVPGAPVRSGPGEGYYVTDSLAEGQAVEVYRHKAGGWCAIRPPEDSFSWVFASHVKQLQDSLAEIDKEDVPSRIGSRLSKRRNAVQVRLKKGEVVQIVGESDEDGQKWYMIAPPAGEFRWIHASAIGRADLVELPPDARGPGLRRGASTTAVPYADPARMAMQVMPPVTTPTVRPIITLSADGVGAPRGLASTANDWRAAPVAPPLAPTTPITPLPNDAVTGDTAGGAADHPGQPPAAAAPVATIAGAAPSGSAATAAVAPSAVPGSTASTTALPPARGPLAEDLARQLTEIELRLSRMVSEPPTAWQIGQLVSETEPLYSHAQTAAERQAVQTTLAKLERFAAIEGRYRQMATAAVGPIPAAEAVPPGTNGAGGGYDAVGVLRPVVSKRPGAPQYALVDERGQVVSFVTASPEVNLQPYVGQRIGVSGNRGFIPEFRRGHVLAGRVTPLEQRLVR